MPKHQKPTVQTVKKQLKKIRDLSVELAEAEYELGLLGLVVSTEFQTRRLRPRRRLQRRRLQRRGLRPSH